jgi:MYXO-CTERM domain-containing protein
MSVRITALLLTGLAFVSPNGAAAFDEPQDFEADAIDGGGGKRFFTGAPSDGFTCKVCHRGGLPSPVRVLGLPLTGYKVGGSYEVTIDWPDELEHVGLNVEITDDHGVAAGTLQLPPVAKLQASEKCTLDGGSAAIVTPQINRFVVGVMPACKSKQLRFLWTAPPEDRGAVRITGSFVTSDKSGDIEGDGVTEIARIIASRSDRDAEASHIQGCSIAHGPARSDTRAWPWLGLLVLAWARLLRRRPR